MDWYSAQLANALLGKDQHAPLLELHYPSSHIQFQKDAIICLAGADFAPVINGHSIPLYHPIIVSKNSILEFQKHRSGTRCYLSFLPELNLQPWMNSYSTNVKCAAGGYNGRALKKGDKICFTDNLKLSSFLNYQDFVLLHWTAGERVRPTNDIDFIIGSEWHWLTKESQENFREQYFQITNDADRMGYHLASHPLEVNRQEQLVSSAVNFGTVQILPNGQLIILMADHQTTGGYPRLAHVISAHLPMLAQKGPNDVIQFRLTDLPSAERKFTEQQRHLRQLQNASKFKIENLLYAAV